MSISVAKDQPARPGLKGLPRSARIVIAVVVMTVGLFQAHKGLLELFPSLGADADVTAAAQKASSAGARFIALTEDVYQTGDPPRQTDAAVAPLLDDLFDVSVLRQKGTFSKADMSALGDWAMAAARVGYVYVLAGTGIADFTKGTSDPKLLAQSDRNTVAYAPEIGRYLDAELIIGGATADLIAENFSEPGLDDKQYVKDGKAKIRNGMDMIIAGAIQVFTLDGISDDWRRDRLLALDGIGPKAAKLLTPEQCKDLRGASRTVGAAMSDVAVKNGLEVFAAALKC